MAHASRLGVHRFVGLQFDVAPSRKRPVSVVQTLRHASNQSAVSLHPSAGPKANTERSKAISSRPLARLSTWSLARNVILGFFFSTPILFRPGFAVLRRVSDSQSLILHPDRNPLLRKTLKPLLYDQFCAGINAAEIVRTRDSIREAGYSGVVLCYGKETVVAKDSRFDMPASVAADEIRQWKDGNLETLDMVRAGDWIGIKFSGAGSSVVEALIKNDDPSAEFAEAIDAICAKAAAQDCRVWIDAEQQSLQKSIDRWTIDLMRKFNVNGKAVVYNTLQAYLKHSRTKLQDQLAIASKEGWHLAIKLVRGAYIDNDPRHLIHDTKQETDDSYNGLVKDLLSGTNLGFTQESFPENIQLIIAGHNPHSISKALDAVNELSAAGRLKVMPDFGQLQGMGDVIGCEFLHRCETENAKADKDDSHSLKAVPKIYKCLTWGSIQECMQYLFRRAVENGGGSDRMRDGIRANVRELRYRLLR